MKSEISDFSLLKNSRFRSITRQPFEIIRPTPSRGDPHAPVDETKPLINLGLPLLCFSTQAVSTGEVQIVIRGRKSASFPGHCPSIFDKADYEIGCHNGFEALEDMCPKGDECSKCHYTKVGLWNHRFLDQTEKFDYSESPPKVNPFMHVCLNQENLRVCELILLGLGLDTSLLIKLKR
jgi:hypothetical protein